MVTGYLGHAGLYADARKLARRLAMQEHSQIGSKIRQDSARRTFPMGALRAKNDPTTPLEAYRRIKLACGPSFFASVLQVR